MNLHKFLGATSRAVLEKVRHELGDDAVIVSNRQTAGGIEITALAGDAFETVIATPPVARPGSRAATLAADGPGTDAPAAAAPKPAEPGAAAPRTAAPGEPRRWEPPRASTLPAAEAPAARTETATATASTATARTGTAIARSEQGLAQRLVEEVRALRGMIEGQFTQLAWGETTRRQPARAIVARELLAARYSATLARRLTEGLPDGLDTPRAREWVQGVLARNIPCAAAEEDIVDRGGVFALVGPTGVGKTTTAAKLAARCAVRHGAGQLALLTTDNYRIGAQDQLRIYARILGVTVHTVGDGEELASALDQLKGRRLVLIDTVGMGQWDPRVAEHVRWLGRAPVRRLLLLNATAQAETLDEVVAGYGAAAGDAQAFAGCIVTKIDESARLGPVLDTVIRHRLPLRYVTNGQRVPEDLHSPNTRYLVHRSLHGRGGGAAAALPGLPDEELAMAVGPQGGLAHA